MVKMKYKNRKKDTALIIANGIIINPEKLRKILLSGYCVPERTMIISVDGGLSNTLRMGFRPDLIIGDMDSIDRSKEKEISGLAEVDHITSNPQKDQSDTQLAVDHAVKLGMGSIFITGATGGRIDHTLANILLLASPGLNDISSSIITDDSEISVLGSSASIAGSPGKLISIFSLTPYTYFTGTSGLKYPLLDEKLYFSPVRGLSNKFTEESAEINIREGKLLIIKEL
jgi:thiamine pyrophosphokinase